MSHASGGKPRLCVLLPSHWAAHMGGAEFQARLIVERLVGLDVFDVHYIARHVDPGFKPEGYSVHAIGSERFRSGAFVPDTPQLWRLLRKLAPDAIYQRVGCAYTGVAAHYAREQGARMVWHVALDRDVTPVPWQSLLRSPLAFADKRLLEYGIRNANAIIVQSRQQCRLLQKHYGRSHSALIPNFHPPVTQSLVKPRDRVTVCWIANMRPFKRPELFLRLARDLQHLPNVDFVMVGRLPARANEEMAARLREVPSVQYRGELPLDEVNDLLAKAHILVNTSDYEGFSNVFIQAWLREVPVVSLRVNTDGVLDSDRYGICAHGDYEVMKTAVAQLVRERERREAIGKEARHFASATYGMGNRDRIVSLLEPRLGELALTSEPQPDASAGASP